jgi:hypothetical protein
MTATENDVINQDVTMRSSRLYHNGGGHTGGNNSKLTALRVIRDGRHGNRQRLGRD